MKVTDQPRIGYDLKEYGEISLTSKPPLPLRCPITLECERAKGSRWLFSREMKETSMLFEYALIRDEGYLMNPTLMKFSR